MNPDIKFSVVLPTLRMDYVVFLAVTPQQHCLCEIYFFVSECKCVFSIRWLWKQFIVYLFWQKFKFCFNSKQLLFFCHIVKQKVCWYGITSAGFWKNASASAVSKHFADRDHSIPCRYFTCHSVLIWKPWNPRYNCQMNSKYLWIFTNNFSAVKRKQVEFCDHIINWCCVESENSVMRGIMPCLRQVGTGFSLWSHKSSCRWVSVIFIVHEMALEQNFLWFFSVFLHESSLHCTTLRLSLPCDICNSFGQAAHYCICGRIVWRVSSLFQCLASYGVTKFVTIFSVEEHKFVCLLCCKKWYVYLNSASSHHLLYFVTDWLTLLAGCKSDTAHTSQIKYFVKPMFIWLVNWRC
jgi:hypothetical protein